MGPLTGITVIDFTRVLSGPYCTMILGDLGARVIKLEHPGRGDDTRRWGPPFLGDESAYFLSVNRNKESVAVDFKTPGGRELVEQLLAQADVVVENFRPGHARRRRPRRGHACAPPIRGLSTAPSRATARPGRGATSPATTR